MDLGWALPISGRYTQSNTVWDKFFLQDLHERQGRHRSLWPPFFIGSTSPDAQGRARTQLIKALAAKDLESAEKLGVLELSEEDLALCRSWTPPRCHHRLLRDMLTTIEKEG